MKKLLFLFLSGLSFIASAQDAGPKNSGSLANPNVIAIDSITQTYRHYIGEVNNMSEGLSGIEQERAASFLTGSGNSSAREITKGIVCFLRIL